MRVVGEAHCAKDGLKKIKSCLPKLVFLDIKLPDMRGFELLDALEKLEINGFYVVFYSAYPEECLGAFKYQPFDFLTKPLTSEALRDSLDRFRRKSAPTWQHADTQQQTMQNEADEKVMLLTQTMRVFVHPIEIMYLQADKKHCHLWMITGECICVNLTLKDVLQKIDKPWLVKKHKSYAANENFITGYSENFDTCYLAHKDLRYEIPVSRSVRKNLRYLAGF